MWCNCTLCWLGHSRRGRWVRMDICLWTHYYSFFLFSSLGEGNYTHYFGWLVDGHKSVSIFLHICGSCSAYMGEGNRCPVKANCHVTFVKKGSLSAPCGVMWYICYIYKYVAYVICTNSTSEVELLLYTIWYICHQVFSTHTFICTVLFNK